MENINCPAGIFVGELLFFRYNPKYHFVSHWWINYCWQSLFYLETIWKWRCGMTNTLFLCSFRITSWQKRRFGWRIDWKMFLECCLLLVNAVFVNFYSLGILLEWSGLCFICKRHFSYTMAPNRPWSLFLRFCSFVWRNWTDLISFEIQICFVLHSFIVHLQLFNYVVEGFLVYSNFDSQMKEELQKVKHGSFFYNSAFCQWLPLPFALWTLLTSWSCWR